MTVDPSPLEDPEPAADPAAPPDPAEPDEATPEPDDLEAELGDRITAQQRALLHQLMIDAAGLVQGGRGFAYAHSGVQYSGVNIHLGDNVLTRRASATTSVLATGPIDAALLERSARTFVEPDCYAALQDLVEAESVAVVFASRGSGGTTLALQVLYALCTAVRKLDPDYDLRRLDTGKLAPDTGYLMEAPPPDKLSQWRDVHLEVLTERLRSNGNRLIITTPKNAREVGVALGHYAVLAAAPPAVSVLKKHLRALLPDTTDDHVNGLYADAEREGLLDGLGPDASVHHAVDLAAAVAEVSAGRSTFDRIRSALDGRTAQRFAEWFAEQETVEQQALVISLAVLHELPWDWVTQGAKNLVALAQPPVPTAEEPPPKPAALLANGQTQRLTRAYAELARAEHETEYGRLTVTTARFRDDTWPLRVLDLVWHEYGDFHDVLLDWLRAYADSPRLAEQVRAASVAGLLARFSFERVYRDVLYPWADSADQSIRMMAAIGLAIAGTDPELSPLVARLLTDWAGPNHGYRLQWTAARAIGLGLGLISPGRAFKVLRTAAAHGDPGILRAVAQSLIEMFIEGDAVLRSRLLDELITWTDPAGRRMLAQPGYLCFLRIAIDVRTEDPDRRHAWPAMLWIANASPADRDRVVLLWQRVLWTLKIGRAARAVLKAWLLMATDHTAQHEPLADLVSRAAPTQRDQEILRHHLARWQVSDPPIAALAGEVLDRLKGGDSDDDVHDRN